MTSKLSVTLTFRIMPSEKDLNEMKALLKKHYKTGKVLVLGGFEHDELIITDLNTNETSRMMPEELNQKRDVELVN